MADKPNENVLAGLRCPFCGAKEPFEIEGTATFEGVTDDGCGQFRNMMWNEQSPIECRSCGSSAEVADFRVPADANAEKALADIKEYTDELPEDIRQVLSGEGFTVTARYIKAVQIVLEDYNNNKGD